MGFLALLVAVVLLMASSASASSFSDVADTHPYSDAIQDLSARGVIGGFADGTFKPNNPVTRQQFAKMIARTLGLTVTGGESCPFSDVSGGQDAGDPFYPDKYVAVCALSGVTTGTTASTFNPSGNITRAQLVTMVVRAAESILSVELETPDDAYFAGEGALFAFTDENHGSNVHLAEFNGLLSHIELADWNLWSSATRGEVAQVLCNLLETQGAPTGARETAYLAQIMDQFHDSFDVYTDADAAGNHFVARGGMGDGIGAEAIPTMNEACRTDPHSGVTCIEATFAATGQSWGGWYFMNGALEGSQTSPAPNWGESPNAGIDLRGATKLTFWARGAHGGERVEFFAFGVGRGAPLESYPDSSGKVTTGYVTLASTWKQYVIDLSGKDLSYVLGGFGWVTDTVHTANKDITFYLDDIRYDKPRLDEPRFLVSYETLASGQDVDVVLRNVAFTYDNALALLAFLAKGESERAGQIADALLYAQEHDRFYDDGRIRNAYQGGDLALPSGWTPNDKVGTVRMPGWYDEAKDTWLEDGMQVGTYTGNVAWAMLALLAYYEQAGGQEYLQAAQRMGDWVEIHCRDTRGRGGYTGGYEEWEPSPFKLTYKATEHNIDLYAAFQRLYLLTGQDKWRDRADYARTFFLSMWDSQRQVFWTGTAADGVAINKTVIPLDIQAWALLALGDDGEAYRGALAYAEDHLSVGLGFDFNEDQDGVWYEGTAQMAAAYAFVGRAEDWRARVEFLETARSESGGIVAASKDGLTTGFYLADGQRWLYHRRVHVGATAWLVLAETQANPFWMGREAP
jgi:hypothetical protein